MKDPFVYQYTFGGLVFLLGLWYAWKQDYIGLQGRRLRNLLVLVGGMAAFAGLQGWLQYSPMTTLPAVEYTGKPYVKEVLGTPLDYGIMVGYFVVMLFIGTWFGRNQKSTSDFFFGGQRFSWWLISFSLVATTIGSYSFVKYSKIAFDHGISSSQTYLNDWAWAPLLVFGWLPILYFSRVVSIPEYFERRFDARSRRVATVLLLVYLIGYVGINLFTMGQALNILLGVDVWMAAAGVAGVSAVYVTFGGQTSVIMTDLFQGAMLLVTGLVLLWLGVEALGGPELFWGHLPRGHRQAFPDFNADPSFPAVGIFWQDAIANSAMFYFLNQGMVMRLMSARNVQDSRRSVLSMLLILMPIAAVVVASGGWVGQALVHAGMLDPTIEAKDAFFITADMLARPGVFGLVMAALTAALMSTVDTLITAIAAIVVNDVYQPLKPEATDKEMLRAARISSISITLFGVLLVPIFMQFDSIYAAHGAFTAAVTPPLVVALLLGVFWRRMTPMASLVTMVGGSIMIFASVIFPELVAPFAHGVEMKSASEGFLAGKDQYKYMRALYGMVVCFSLGIGVSIFTKPRSLESVRGLVWGTVGDAIKNYKGSKGAEVIGPFVDTQLAAEQMVREPGAHFAPARISSALAALLGVSEGDLLYVSDRRAWLGGLRATHAKVVSVFDGSEPLIRLCKEATPVVAAGDPTGRVFRVQALYKAESTL
jgi:SSS family solute:Na+ symporter